LLVVQRPIYRLDQLFMAEALGASKAAVRRSRALLDDTAAAISNLAAEAPDEPEARGWSDCFTMK
jgi:hypothetical protein